MSNSFRLADTASQIQTVTHTGALIINADDWGRSREVTDRTLECFCRRTVSSVSAMVFMEDSERAAEIARIRAIDAGLHLNLTQAFSARNVTERLTTHHNRINAYLKWHALARVFFHPGLVHSFEYVVKTQIEEFARLYGSEPNRIDGHHHMHLCSNVLLGHLLPSGCFVRRNFSFQSGEKSFFNRLYRRRVDRRLATRYRLTDFFFSLQPLQPPSRLERVFSLAHQFKVEVETHPIQPQEYEFLVGEEIRRRTDKCGIAEGYSGSQRVSIVK